MSKNKRLSAAGTRPRLNTMASVICLATVCLFSSVSLAQEEPQPRSAPNANVLDAEQWKQVDTSVERGLEWLITQQEADGSFETTQLGQPGITALSLMAFLAQGESPIDGRHQQQLSKAIDYIVAQQKANGLIAINAPDAVPIPRFVQGRYEMSVTAVYNHAIASLSLCEAYGQCSPEQAKRLTPVIEKAIAATLEMQRWGGKEQRDKGGWRYIDKRDGYDSDLSVTGWQLMFLRSARNAGFDVAKEPIEQGVRYIERCFIDQLDRKVHGYIVGNKNACTRAMAGEGVLALAHAGKHDSQQAIGSGNWILEHGFGDYHDDTHPYDAWPVDRYHYGALQCSQAMYQLGGKYWKQFFPTLVDTLLANQQADGSWPPDRREKEYGSCYSTSLSILSMSVPNQMLPIFQR